MNGKRAFFLAFAAAALVVAATGPAQAVLRQVPLSYPTIQAAENASLPGDTITIQTGVYFENVTVDVDRLTIQGTSCAAPPIVDGGNFVNDVFYVTSVNVKFQCLVLRHGDDGIYADPGTGLTVNQVKIFNTGEDGIYIADGDYFNIQNTQITGPGSDGIYVEEGDYGVILKTTVRQTDEYCFYLDDVYNGRFESNTAFQCEDEYGFYIYGDYNSIRSNTATHTEYSGLYVYGDHNAIAKNVLDNTGYSDESLYVVGDDNVIEYNTVSNTYYDAIDAYGDRNVIRYNTLTNFFDDYCIDFGGEDVKVLYNTCTYGYYGIYTDGYARPRIEGNVVRSAGFDSFDITATAPVVLNNRAEKSGDDLFDLECTGDCAFGLIQGNVADGAADDSDCFNISIGDPAGISITGNTAQNCSEDGFYVDCDFCKLTSNTAKKNGNEDDCGIMVYGDGNTLTSNVASENDCTGFCIEGYRNVLRTNRAETNLQEGFLLIAGYSDNLLDRNVARVNLAEGIDNKADATDLTSNSSSGNRTDCTNDGTIDLNTANLCSDGSNFLVTSQID